jgi:Rha family phage regulatory protein
MDKLTELNPNATMSSREIAEITGKQHAHVMRDIREVESQITESKFGLSEYKDSTGRILPMYELTKKQTLLIISGYNIRLRMAIIDRWEELENKYQIPQTLGDALLLAGRLALENERTKHELSTANNTIIALEPKRIFADAVSASKTTILVGELAKILNQNGINIGQNRFFEWLRQNGYLISRKGTDYNMPTQKSMDLKLFVIKETSITHSDGHISISKTTKVTGYGQTYFVNKLLRKPLLNQVNVKSKYND